jgi:hypothetical protein
MVTALKAPAKKSSVVAATAYDIATRTLRVQFHGKSKVYDYTDVPQETVDAMHQAESIGSYIAKNVIGKFPHQAHETA